MKAYWYISLKYWFCFFFSHQLLCEISTDSCAKGPTCIRGCFDRRYTVNFTGYHHKRRNRKTNIIQGSPMQKWVELSRSALFRITRCVQTPCQEPEKTHQELTAGRKGWKHCMQCFTEYMHDKLKHVLKLWLSPLNNAHAKNQLL